MCFTDVLVLVVFTKCILLCFDCVSWGATFPLCIKSQCGKWVWRNSHEHNCIWYLI